MTIIKKKALFVDSKNNEQHALITICEGFYVGILVTDSNSNETGYMNIYFHPDKRFYLDTVYCYDQFRNRGIATFMSKLSDYILKDYVGYVIRGVYEPGQLSTDRENNIMRNQDELEIAARSFYETNGYQIISYEDYCNNKERFPYLMDSDFCLGEDDPSTIVAKVLAYQDCLFREEDGKIYCNDLSLKKTKERSNI